MSRAERLLAVEATVAAARGRVPVVAGVLSPGYEEALQAGLDFVGAGAVGILLVTPFYVTPTEAGLRAYFEKYRKAVDVPILLYDIPSRTRYTTPVATIAAMGRNDGTIIGMKACSTDLPHVGRTVTAAGSHVAVMSGDDTLYVQHALLGCTGGILTSSSIVPAIWHEIHNAIISGEISLALARHATLMPFLDALFAETNPGPIKAAFTLMGQSIGGVKLPLISASETTLARLRDTMPAVGLVP
jgi:4-hydroxy-tetrahydrodipicolinate synthase